MNGGSWNSYCEIGRKPSPSKLAPQQRDEGVQNSRRFSKAGSTVSRNSDSQKPVCPSSAKSQTLSHSNIERPISTDDGGVGPDFKLGRGSVDLKSRLITNLDRASTRHGSQRVDGNYELLRLRCERDERCGGNSYYGRKRASRHSSLNSSLQAFRNAV